MKRRIKHNNLLPWFTEDHARLPASYIKSCQKFFQEIGEKTFISRVEFYANELQAASYKRQATSSKPATNCCASLCRKIQAASNKQQASRRVGSKAL
jgi:hypothetical protein